jgi:hypothetical protein
VLQAGLQSSCLYLDFCSLCIQAPVIFAELRKLAFCPASPLLLALRLGPQLPLALATRSHA